MKYTDLHTHSNFCDGRDTPEEMVLSAISKGLKTYGIVTHSYTEYDKPCSINPEREAEFIAEVNRLKEKYKDKIKLLCGVEVDFYSTKVADGYDYRIGAVHYLEVGGSYLPIDLSEQFFKRLVKEHFNGDYYALAEEYYRLVGELGRLKPDIIAHFDLVTKYNEDDCLFDTKHPRYQRAARAAVDKLIPLGVPFEINTGAISRGYRATPYPSPELRKYIAERGGSFLLSSDSHAKENIAFMFDNID